MARVSISEAARLVKVSRPTIYKMINSGKLSYTSVVKHGKGIKVIDTSELIRGRFRKRKKSYAKLVAAVVAA